MICAARGWRPCNRVLKQLLRHGRIFREGKTAWTKLHRAWLAGQRLDDPLAQEALEQLLIHLDGIERQLDTLDARLAEIAGSERWVGQVEILTRFRGISTLTALGLIAEIGDFARFSHPRELASWLGIPPSEYSSGDQQHRGHITLSGNKHARRLLIEAAWHYRHAPRPWRHPADRNGDGWITQVVGAGRVLGHERTRRLGWPPRHPYGDERIPGLATLPPSGSGPSDLLLRRQGGRSPRSAAHRPLPFTSDSRRTCQRCSKRSRGAGCAGDRGLAQILTAAVRIRPPVAVLLRLESVRMSRA
jgi:hypothetical protein